MHDMAKLAPNLKDLVHSIENVLEALAAEDNERSDRMMTICRADFAAIVPLLEGLVVWDDTGKLVADEDAWFHAFPIGTDQESIDKASEILARMATIRTGAPL